MAAGAEVRLPNTLVAISETLEGAAQGQVVAVGTFPLTVAIDGNGNVTVTDADGDQYKGQLSGTSFSARGTSPAPPRIFGVTGSPVNFTYQGTIEGDQITGSSNGNITCTVPGGITRG